MSFYIKNQWKLENIIQFAKLKNKPAGYDFVKTSQKSFNFVLTFWSKNRQNQNC